MPGVITKKTVFICPVTLYHLGGMKLIWAVLTAKNGTPFLTVWVKVCGF